MTLTLSPSNRFQLLDTHDDDVESVSSDGNHDDASQKYELVQQNTSTKKLKDKKKKRRKPKMAAEVEAENSTRRNSDKRSSVSGEEESSTYAVLHQKQTEGELTTQTTKSQSIQDGSSS